MYINLGLLVVSTLEEEDLPALVNSVRLRGLSDCIVGGCAKYVTDLNSNLSQHIFSLRL